MRLVLTLMYSLSSLLRYPRSNLLFPMTRKVMSSDSSAIQI